MYWPSVQENPPGAPLAKGVTWSAPRLYGRPFFLDLERLREATPSPSVVTSLRAWLQPIAGGIRARDVTARTTSGQWLPTSAAWKGLSLKPRRDHEQPACTR